MAIINARMRQKRGPIAQLDKDKLLPGEFAIPEDSDKIYICIKAGVVLEIPSTQSIQGVFDTLNAVVAQGTQMIDDFRQLEIDKVGIDDNNVSTMTTYSSEKITKLINEADTAENTVTYESNDSIENVTWTDVPVLSSTEKHKSIFGKISNMFKNVRYLYKMLSKLNSNLNNFGVKKSSGFYTNLGAYTGYAGIVHCYYICTNSDNQKLYMVNVDCKAITNTQSQDTNNYFLNMACIMSEIVKAEGSALTFKSILNTDAYIRYISQYDGQPVSDSLYGYGMALRVIDRDFLRLGRYYNISGDYGSWANNLIPPLRLGFDLIIVCENI